MQNTAGLVGQNLGQYRIIEQIGEGGMATVFKAYQPGLNREVALKILPPYFANQADFTERFAREAQAIGNLHHPNILPVYDSGQDKGYSYLVMRYIPQARTLADEMKTPLKTERIIEVIGQIAGALDHAHKAGIIHRDIKPSNVLLDGKWALLSDFGLAKMVESSSELTGSGVGMGTPAYMSPEQGMGKKVDYHTDIYALGIILYEMLTGQVPHRAETPIATVFKRINEPLPLPRNLNPNIPEAVERVLLKTLAPDPAQRFDSAGEMAAALKTAFGPTPNEFITDLDKTQPAASPRTDPDVVEPTRVSPPSLARSEPAKSGLPLNPWGFGAVGLLLVMVLVGIGIFIYQGTSSSNTNTPLPQISATQNGPDSVKDKAQPAGAASTATPAPPTAAPATVAATSTPPEQSGDTGAYLSATSTVAAAPPPSEQSGDKGAYSATSTVAAAPATAYLTPVVPAASTPTIPPTTAPTPVPAAAALTGAEIQQLALAEAVKWQPDAVLSEISTTAMGPLDAEGKSTDWQLKYWSPSTKQMTSLMFMKGTFATLPSSSLPVPKATVLGDQVILDTKRLYDIAEKAGAAQFTAEGYRPMASIVPYPLDESRLTWYFNYQGGDYRVVFTVILDAVSGEVIQAIKLE